MQMDMKNKLKTQEKESNKDLFFKVNISAIKDSKLLHCFHTPSELKVLLALACFINEKGEAYPSQSYLASLTGLNRSTVCRVISNLKKESFLGENLLSVEKVRYKNNKFGNNKYRLGRSLGITFGKDVITRTPSGTVSHREHTNKNNTNNKNHLLNKNKIVSPLNKKQQSVVQSTNLLAFKKGLNKEEQNYFDFQVNYSLEHDSSFQNNTAYVQNTLRKNISLVGLENWKKFTRSNHSTPMDLWNFLTYQVAQNGKTYAEALLLWDKEH